MAEFISYSYIITFIILGPNYDGTRNYPKVRVGVTKSIPRRSSMMNTEVSWLTGGNAEITSCASLQQSLKY